MSDREIAQVTTSGGSVYELAVDLGLAGRQGAASQRTVTLPYETTSSPQAWWARLSAAAIRDLPTPPPGTPRDWA